MISYRKLSVLPCQEHPSEPLNLVCVDPRCQKRGLFCCLCQQQRHNEHIFISTSTIFKQIQQSLENIADIPMLLQSSEIDKAVSDLKITLSLTKYQKQAIVQEGLKRVLSITRQQLRNIEGYLKQAYNCMTDAPNRQQFNKILQKHLFHYYIEEKQQGRLIDNMVNRLKTRMVTMLNDVNKRIREDNSCPAETLLNIMLSKDVMVSRFRFSEDLKGKSIKLLSPVSIVMETSGSDRMALMEPSLQRTNCIIKWKVNIICKKSWIGVGICHINSIKDVNFNFQYTNTGHGNYLISSNGYSWSSLKPQYNSHFQPFTFETGDVIEVTYNPFIKKVLFKKQSTEDTYSLDFDFQAGNPLHPAINLTGAGDSAEVIQ